jgi:large subunit ribosomal protein L29
MKKKEKKEFFAKTIQELRKLLEEKKEELFQLSQELAQGKLKNTRSVFHKKKDIARILTILREKELLENVKNI